MTGGVDATGAAIFLRAALPVPVAFFVLLLPEPVFFAFFEPALDSGGAITPRRSRLSRDRIEISGARIDEKPPIEGLMLMLLGPARALPQAIK